MRIGCVLARLKLTNKDTAMTIKSVQFDDTAKKLNELSQRTPTSITQLLLSLLSTEEADELSLATHYRIAANEANQLQTRVIKAINTVDPDDSEATVSDLLLHASIIGRVSSHLSLLASSVKPEMEAIDTRRKQRGTLEQQRERLEDTFRSRMAKPTAVTTVAGKKRPRLFSRTEANF